MQLMGSAVRKIAPDFTGPIEPQESVEMMRRVVDAATGAETGAFVSQEGNKEWI